MKYTVIEMEIADGRTRADVIIDSDVHELVGIHQIADVYEAANSRGRYHARASEYLNGKQTWPGGQMIVWGAESLVDGVAQTVSFFKERNSKILTDRVTEKIASAYERRAELETQISSLNNRRQAVLDEIFALDCKIDDLQQLDLDN